MGGIALNEKFPQGFYVRGGATAPWEKELGIFQFN